MKRTILYRLMACDTALAVVAVDHVGGIDALVEMKLGAIEEGSSAAGAVRYGSAQGANVQFLPMPYVLDALDL